MRGHNVPEAPSWIPACAGMTGRGFGISPRHSRAGGNPAACVLHYGPRNNATFQIHRDGVPGALRQCRNTPFWHGSGSAGARDDCARDDGFAGPLFDSHRTEHRAARLRPRGARQGCFPSAMANDTNSIYWRIRINWAVDVVPLFALRWPTTHAGITLPGGMTQSWCPHSAPRARSPWGPSDPGVLDTKE